MKLEYVLRITLLLLMMALSDSQSTGRPITCMAGTFARGQPATVTCNLHTDVSATELGFNVVRYLPTAPKHDLGKDILVCEWKTEERKHHCTAKDDYAFNIGQDSFTINIPAVTEESAGLYMCFFLPQDTKKSHPCELIVTEVPRGTALLPPTTIKTMMKPAEKGEQSHVWVIIFATVFVVASLALLIAVGVFLFMKRRRSKKQKQKKKRDEHAEFGLILPMLPKDNDDKHVPGEDEAFVKRMWDSLDGKTKHILEGFVNLDDVCREVTTLLHKEIEAAFMKEASATIEMFSTLVKCLPTGTENGQFLVLNLGSRSLRIIFVKIEGKKIDSHGSVNYKIPQDVRLGTCIQLLNFIDNRLRVFMTAKELSGTEISVGLVFSFPCKYDVEHDLSTARAVKWTKGFDCTGVLGKDLGKLLQQKMKKKKTTCKLTIKAIINDAVGLLMAGVNKDQACKISFIIGKGVNGCYIKADGQDSAADRKTIVATEWGALGENGSLDQFRTEFDKTAVQFSMSPKEQILEKMVGRLYIGEIVREVLLKLATEGPLSESFYSELPALNEKRGFTTEHVLYIDNDMDEDCVLTRDLLVQLQFDNITERDCKLVKFVCRIVLRRAAYLAAAALATLIQHVQQSNVTIAIDGSLWRSHLRFKNQMMAKTRDLVGPNYTVTFLSILDGSGIGAALTTAISLN